MDLNVKTVQKNAFRITKDRYKTALRIRVPGGRFPTQYFATLNDVAQVYGDGDVHITTRQGFEITGIDIDKMDEVNKLIQPVIEGLNINQEEQGQGYSAAGTRNVTACIGNRVCPMAHYETSEFARKIENAIFPNDFHVKVALTGCPNDCIKARMHDFGIIGMALPVLEADRCVSCGRCVKKCTRLSTGALSMENYNVRRDHEKCIGCGECVVTCPMNAWTRSEHKYYKLAIMGRTGRKNPRLAEDFIVWADEESVIKIITNTYDYINEYIDRTLPKEHIGYIVDRTGFMEFKKWALKDVTLNDMAKVAHNISWSGIHYTGPFS